MNKNRIAVRVIRFFRLYVPFVYGLAGCWSLQHLFHYPHADAPAVACESRLAIFIGGDALFPIAEKVAERFTAVVFAQRQSFFSRIAVGHYDHAAWILIGAAAAEGNAVGMIEPQRLYAVGETLTREDQLVEMFNYRHIDVVGLAILSLIHI